VRAPLLGQPALLENWLVSFAMCALGWLITLAFYGRFRRRVAYWL